MVRCFTGKKVFSKIFIFGGSGPKLPYLGIWAQIYVLLHIFMKNYYLIVVESILEVLWLCASRKIEKILNFLSFRHLHPEFQICDQIPKYGNLVPDPQKMKMFKQILLHVKGLIITLQTSPQPLSDDIFS